MSSYNTAKNKETKHVNTHVAGFDIRGRTVGELGERTVGELGERSTGRKCKMYTSKLTLLFSPLERKSSTSKIF